LINKFQEKKMGR